MPNNDEAASKKMTYHVAVEWGVAAALVLLLGEAILWTFGLASEGSPDADFLSGGLTSDGDLLYASLPVALTILAVMSVVLIRNDRHSGIHKGGMPNQPATEDKTPPISALDSSIQDIASNAFAPTGPARAETLNNLFRLMQAKPESVSSAAQPASCSTSCRFCGTALFRRMSDLGAQPLSNSYLTHDDLKRSELTWPLRTFVCENCLLVQVEDSEAPERIFSDYAYFSSYSCSWLRHAQRYSEMIVDRLRLDHKSQVIEIASNDGYLLQNFVGRGIPSLGIEPANNVARVALNKGIPTRICFLNTRTANQLRTEGFQADLLIGNNVLAHVPDLNDFVASLGILLKPQGTLTMEFPHLLRLMQDTQFDTIYHEHFFYYSLITARRIFAAHQMQIFDVESLPTHGGSLRIYVAHNSRGDRTSGNVSRLLKAENEAGLDRLETYELFDEQVRRVKRNLVRFLLEAKENGKTVAAYGAAAKGNTLLNYCGLRSDVIDFVADANTFKQGRYLPGTRIPIVSPELIRETRPDYVLILPWNLKEEIIAEHGYIRDWGGRFVVPIPSLSLIP